MSHDTDPSMWLHRQLKGHQPHHHLQRGLRVPTPLERHFLLLTHLHLLGELPFAIKLDSAGLTLAHTLCYALVALLHLMAMPVLDKQVPHTHHALHVAEPGGCALVCTVPRT